MLSMKSNCNHLCRSLSDSFNCSTRIKSADFNARWQTTWNHWTRFEIFDWNSLLRFEILWFDILAIQNVNKWTQQHAVMEATIKFASSNCERKTGKKEKYFEFYANTCEWMHISVRLSIYLVGKINIQHIFFCAWWNLNNGTFAPIQLDIRNETIHIFHCEKRKTVNNFLWIITINTHIWNNEADFFFLFYGRSLSGNILRTC